MHDPTRDDDGSSGRARSKPLQGAAAVPARASAAASEEILVALPSSREKLEPVSQIRSTVLTTSLKAMRDRGYGDRYLALLPAQYHEALRTCFAGAWLPIEIGLAHYEACDALDLSTQEQFAIGKEVGLKIQGTFLGGMVKLARGVGVTPWLCMSKYQRLYERLFVGGGVIVTKLGPKEARIEALKLPLSRIPYFRTAFRGLNEASCELFCTKAYVEELRALRTPTSLGYRISWA